MKHSISAVIFAGGKSSRMGKDKALLPFGDAASLSEFQYKRLEMLFKTVYLSTKKNKFDFECKIIQDRYDVHSALVALLSIFETIDEEMVFVLSVDAPFVDASVIEKLLSHNEKHYDVIVAKSPQGREPLCALYKRSVVSAARSLLKADNHRLNDLLKTVRFKEVTFQTDLPFTNLNHPQEYERALRLLL